MFPSGKWGDEYTCGTVQREKETVCTQGVLRVSRGQQRIGAVGVGGGAWDGGRGCDGRGGVFFPSGFCFTLLTFHSLKTVFEVPQSQRANLVSHHGMLVRAC